MLKLLILISIISLSTFAQYYKTLPKNVRSLLYKNITSNDIDSGFNQTNSRSPYTFNIKADYEALSQIENSFVQDVLNALGPDATSLLSLGEYQIKGNANIKADIFGFGYGITNKLTVYAGLPIFDASVKIDYKRTQGNTYAQISEFLQEQPNNTQAQTYGSILEQLSSELDFNAAVLQGIAQNQLGFKPVGDWRGHGLGDIELGFMYNFLTKDKYGLMLSGGLTAPTGREDDPDLLQDFGFGDGQWDAFVEFGGGFKLTSTFTLNAFSRYTYQFASIKELRRPTSKDFKYSANKGEFTEKLGNKLLIHVGNEYSINDWFIFNSAYEFNHQGQAQYFSNFEQENKDLAYRTSSSAHHMKLGAKFHTVTLFQKKKFIAPASVELKVNKMLTGTNIPNIDIYELEFRMFF